MKVAVVGGGMLGLTLAQRLMTRGHRVELIEAQPELGHRLLAPILVPHGHDAPPQPVELGEELLDRERVHARAVYRPHACDLPSDGLRLDKPLLQALEGELRLGLKTLASGESVAGAQRFMGGAGRHGS